ncbi:hypothetical protein SAMN05519104_7700 [Rhizobiales bacterium GAS188]|nr:hypothetical protein SAMN05519104_7700 [Rhizobiales bacterium GAS188]
MIRESHNAVVARNEEWRGSIATEPYEAGWAREAIVFVRALSVEGAAAGIEARVQISPDGIRWIDEGTRFELPAHADEVTFARVAHFGNWLRVVAELPDGLQIYPVVTISLKA